MSSVVRKQLMYTYLVLFKLLKLNENMKTIRQIGMALLAIAWGATLTSCSDDNENNNSNNPSQDPIEDFNQGNMNFTEEAGEQAFTFKANASWSVSVAETSGGTTWCTVSPASGEAGEQVVTVKVNANETYDDRNVTLTLKAGTETETFVVTQKQRNALLLTSDKYEVDQKGGTITVEVKANIDYTATISEICKDWITETTDASRGLTTTTKSYQISANEDGEKREGTIVFSDGTLTETVHVYQAGGNVILLTENEYYADAAGEEITVELRSNCEYEAVMPSVDWIHEAASRAMSSHTLHYTIDPNETYDNREAIIIYKDKNNSTADTLTIIQAQKDAIVLTEKEYTVSPEGETIEVKLASNTEYTITIASYARGWITEVEDTNTKALVDSKHYFQIARNNSSSERRGTITFSNGKGIKETITVIQEKPTLKLISDDEIQVTAENQMLEFMLNANVDFNVLSQVDWVKFVEKKQEDGKFTVTLSVNENSEESQRAADILFSNEEYKIEEKLLVIQQAKAQIVTVKLAGTLSSLVNNYKEIESLKINGPINGTDIKFLRSIFTKPYKLKSLDLSDVSIVEGGDYYYYWNGGFETANNVIGEHMFENAKLDKLVLPENVTYIGNFAFKECYLKDLTMPNGVVEFAGTAFTNSYLSDIRIPNLTAWCNSHFTAGGCFEYAENVFVNDELLTDLVIPDDVTSISTYAFSPCSSLITVYIPSNVSRIGNYSFRSCDNLKEVTIDNGVKEIGIGAFSTCDKLEKVVVPNSVTAIGESAFSTCRNLTEINIPNSITKIEPNTFSGTGISHIEISNNITEIGIGAFYSCRNLTEINIPNSIAKIEHGTFENCINLANIIIGNRVAEIGSEAFFNVSLRKCYIYATTPPVIDDTSFKSTNYAETTLYVPKGCVQAYTDSGWGYYFYNIVEMDK